MGKSQKCCINRIGPLYFPIFGKVSKVSFKEEDVEIEPTVVKVYGN